MSLPLTSTFMVTMGADTPLASFFLFHASLVIALAVVGDAESPDLPRWHEELDTARHVFRTLYANNPLASRCADILDLIVPDAFASTIDWTDVSLDPAALDFSTWPNDSSDMFGLSGWLPSGPE